MVLKEGENGDEDDHSTDLARRRHELADAVGGEPVRSIAFVITVITASGVTLGLFMAAFVLMWAATTAQHAFGPDTPLSQNSPSQNTAQKVG
ncbi:hypothetical protein AB0I28_14270 [Phytomonospora sp. NPDC050363]|uniref:hypothetical protein n=1 Tax=Phytomonospora sp. NPDC050363 TaxID=3155642 RepID=UPI0033C80C3D